MDVRCISDSGSLYPFQDHTDFCFPQLLEYAAFEVKISLEEHQDMSKLIMFNIADLERHL